MRFEEFLLDNPEDTEAMNRLGAIYCDSLGRFDAAKEVFEKALVLNPNANGTQGNLAVVARKTGNFEERKSGYINEGYTNFYEIAECNNSDESDKLERDLINYFITSKQCININGGGAGSTAESDKYHIYLVTK